MKLTQQELEKLILEQAQNSLADADIHELDTYGWQSHDVIDPEFSGHALMQMNPPYDWDIINPPAETPALEQWQKDCAIAQADFFGIMEMARLSIGLTRVHGEEYKNNALLGQSPLFDLHRMGATVNLSIASDRIRDFFITFEFKCTVKEYQSDKNVRPKRSLYQSPFIEASGNLTSVAQSISVNLKLLQERAEQIRSYRDTRNGVIHDIATHQGRFEKRRINNELQTTTINIMNTVESFQQLQDLHSKVFNEHKAKIDQILTDLTKWFELLIKFSNDIFLLWKALESQRKAA